MFLSCEADADDDEHDESDAGQVLVARKETKKEEKGLAYLPKLCGQVFLGFSTSDIGCKTRGYFLLSDLQTSWI